MTKGMFKGFTLIELVIVIVILGILAAVALPRFYDLSGAARSATVSGVAGALSSAASNNYGARVAGASGTSAVSNCTDAAALLATGLPSGYTITAAALSTTAGAPTTCTVTGPNSVTATFTAIYVT